MKKSPPPASEAIRDFKPYTSARMLNALDEDGIYLDANESPATFDFPPIDLRNVRHYADDKDALEAAYADFAGCRRENVLAMRGVDEVVDLVIRGYCEPGDDRILAFSPTYGGYRVAAAAHRVRFAEAPFDRDGAIDVAGAAAQGARVLFVCRPNNPTGAVTALSQLADLAEAVADDAVIAVDEAYIEFARAPSALDLLPEYANLVLMRTMSKAFGLAGAHVGFAVGHADVVEVLRRIINPYPVADPCIQLARAALGESGRRFLARRVRENALNREAFAGELRRRPECLEALPSQTNFVAARFDGADAIHERLRANKIFIRPLAPMFGHAGWLRFTIGAREEMEKVLQCIAE